MILHMQLLNCAMRTVQLIKLLHYICGHVFQRKLLTRVSARIGEIDAG